MLVEMVISALTKGTEEQSLGSVKMRVKKFVRLVSGKLTP